MNGEEKGNCELEKNWESFQNWLVVGFVAITYQFIIHSNCASKSFSQCGKIKFVYLLSFGCPGFGPKVR